MSINLDELRESTAIDVIVSAKYYTKVFFDSKEIVLCLVHPFCADRLYSDFLYESAYNEAIDNGLLPKDELKKIIRKRGLVTEKDERYEQDLIKRIEGQEALFDKMRFVKDKKNKVKENIIKLKSELFELRSKINRFYSFSAENIANEVKINYLCWASCYKESGVDRLWDRYSDFESEKNFSFRSKIVNIVLTFLVGFSEKTLRKLARSSDWRIRYVSSVKASFPLFSRKPDDYTKDQIALMYWSNFYQNIYEMLPEDRPADDVIENDVLLDAYMQEYYKSLEQDRLVSKSKKMGTNAFDSDEVIVTQFNDLYDKLDYDDPKEASRNKNATDLNIRRNKK